MSAARLLSSPSLLTIALGILAARGQVPIDSLCDVECLGELAARDAGRALVVPQENAEEACLASGLSVLAANNLMELVAHFSSEYIPTTPTACCCSASPTPT